MKNPRRLYLVSLGCPKNLVDSEVMGGFLSREGFTMTNRPDDADVIIVNTCAFITPAKEESIEEIFRMARWKEHGPCTRLIVTGCLPQRYGSDLIREIPEVDLFLGIAEVPNIVRHLEEIDMAGRTGSKLAAGEPSYLMDSGVPRLLSTPPYLAYLKIAEGCSNCCSYCAIPAIRGPFRSRKHDDILKEAAVLADRGVRELIVTAQDSTAYGRDLEQPSSLSRLMKDLASIDKLRWIRLLYTYPGNIRDDLLRVISEERKICPYIDMPIQHIDNRVLKAMNRRSTESQIREAVRTIRETVADVVLRTSIIVGFPGETKPIFHRLLAFVQEARFDHLGVFLYSREEGTAAARITSRITAREKELRRQLLMEEQAVISYCINQSLVGTTQEVLIEGRSDHPDYPYIGRCRRQAPDIDGITYVKGRGLAPGDFIACRLEDAQEYDLYGKAIHATNTREKSKRPRGQTVRSRQLSNRKRAGS
jgi:ribosomal protein S12 methylthiotransferase